MNDPVSFNINDLYNVEGLTVVITGGGTGLGKGEFWWAETPAGDNEENAALISQPSLRRTLRTVPRFSSLAVARRSSTRPCRRSRPLAARLTSFREYLQPSIG